jgi:glutathione S-transferase
MSEYVLHYASDNASLIVRLVLQELGVPYATRLVDRQNAEQRPEAYHALNPAGRIPALETHHGPICETPVATDKALRDTEPTLCNLYAPALLRWSALYPVDEDRSWFRLADWPNLATLARRIEARASAKAAMTAEGLGPTPFSDPHLPNPPEGSAV